MLEQVVVGQPTPSITLEVKPENCIEFFFVESPTTEEDQTIGGRVVVESEVRARWRFLPFCCNFGEGEGVKIVLPEVVVVVAVLIAAEEEEVVAD